MDTSSSLIVSTGSIRIRRSNLLQHRGNALSAADAHGGESIFSFTFGKQQRGLSGHARAGCAERMAERDRPAFKVELALINTKFLDDGERLRGKCLVEFDEVY